MAPTLRREEEVEALIEGFAWGPHATDEALRETLRAELAALGTSWRHVLADRVLRCAVPAVESPEALRERVRALVDALDAVGDLFVGDGGLVGAAPVRAVPITQRVWVVVGTVTTRALRRALPTAQVEATPTRRVTTAEPGEPVAAALGAREVTLERWTGLDDAPPTLAAWRDELDARIQSAPEALGEETTQAERYVPRGPNGATLRRWRPVGDAQPPYLERQKRFSWHTWRWVDGVRAVPLTRGEASRTVLLLDAEMGVPRELRCAMLEEQRSRVVVDAFLPPEEYRLLLGLGTPTGERGGWVLPAAVAERVLPTLAARLGLEYKREES